MAERASASSASTVPIDSIIREYEPGMAGGDKCPRRGTIFMRTRKGVLAAIETSCKSWKCLACRDRKLSMVRGVMSYGVLAQKRCYLVLLTLKSAEGKYRRSTKQPESLGRLPGSVGVQDVEKLFRSWLDRLKYKYPCWAKVTWTKVVELTEVGMPHLHLILGGLDESLRMDCKPNRKFQSADWLDENCHCIRHQMGRAWYGATGDSFFVGIKLVYNAYGAAAYITKYLTKTFVGSKREELEEKGFLRRISYSRNWPRGGHMKRRGTINNEWRSVGFEPGGGSKWRLLKEMTSKLPEAERVGNEIAEMMDKRRQRRAFNKYAENRSGQGSDRDRQSVRGIPRAK